MDSQSEEMLLRLKALLPQTASDARFVLCLATVEENIIPVVYLREDDTEGEVMPDRYLLILKKAEDKYSLKLQGFFNTTHFVFPVAWWPHHVQGAELDHLVIEIFEGWIKTCETINQEVKRLSGPDITCLPL